MSYINKVLNSGQSNTNITDFLLSEGFKYGTGAMGGGKMYYVASGGYTVWFALCDDYLSLYAEYNCGGCIGKKKFRFKSNDFENFHKAYLEAVDWVKRYI